MEVILSVPKVTQLTFWIYVEVTCIEDLLCAGCAIRCCPYVYNLVLQQLYRIDISVMSSCYEALGR